MPNTRPLSIAVGIVILAFMTFTVRPLSAAPAGKIPASLLALFPKGAQFGHGDFSVMPTEFGKTFGGDLNAASFPGKNPSCDLAGTTMMSISIKGDTAFNEPPMLDMFVAEFEQNLANAAAPLKTIATSYAKGVPNVVSVGTIKQVKRPNGHLFFIQYQEDCGPHPKGFKTKLRGLAHRGATQLDFTLWLALDEAATQAIAEEILANFQKLDIAALTK